MDFCNIFKEISVDIFFQRNLKLVGSDTCSFAVKGIQHQASSPSAPICIPLVKTEKRTRGQGNRQITWKYMLKITLVGIIR